MDAEFPLYLVDFGSALEHENVSGYFGPMTHERVVQAHKHFSASAAHALKAAALAPDEASEVFLFSLSHCSLTYYNRQLSLADFDPAAAFGAGGSRLREVIERCAAALPHAACCTAPPTIAGSTTVRR